MNSLALMLQSTWYTSDVQVSVAINSSSIQYPVIMYFRLMICGKGYWTGLLSYIIIAKLVGRPEIMRRCHQHFRQRILRPALPSRASYMHYISSSLSDFQTDLLLSICIIQVAHHVPWPLTSASTHFKEPHLRITGIHDRFSRTNFIASFNADIHGRELHLLLTLRLNLILLNWFWD